jgi:8-oxo-dGTP pyrophosphatase MutT (NUDIX family)
MKTTVSPSDVETAGVLLKEADRYVFCYGPHASGAIYVLRIGGHLEAGESPWECAAREAKEEASAVVHQIPASSSVKTDGIDGPIVDLPSPVFLDGYPSERPLVLGGSLEPGTAKSTLFLAETQDISHPSNEVFGLVKLTAEGVVQIARTPHTFVAIERTAIPQDRQVEVASSTPLLISSHLRALAYCLERGYV